MLYCTLNADVSPRLQLNATTHLNHSTEWLLAKASIIAIPPEDWMLLLDMLSILVSQNVL